MQDEKQMGKGGDLVIAKKPTAEGEVGMWKTSTSREIKYTVGRSPPCLCSLWQKRCAGVMGAQPGSRENTEKDGKTVVSGRATGNTTPNVEFHS